ncbi:uncharacterized protein [Spinacia oleracea]|uniref:Fumarylacetoacetase-like C-terminal domain-containing protein n=1 Tax=Spinacia oleracea TaxID=3562 RepID=A0ABM3RTL0_SPIOL|nr:uncharacterized protein LOC110788515 [Spinacia oleracea]XP_056698947.1 uncharacterized protein LOC110788515 [Spinacia oleracea]
MIPVSAVPDPHNLEPWLDVDGESKQKGSTKDIIFKIPFLISHISSFMTLMEGDVILTGTSLVFLILHKNLKRRRTKTTEKKNSPISTRFLAAVEAVLVLVVAYSASPGAAAGVLDVGCIPDLQYVLQGVGWGVCSQAVRPDTLFFAFVVFGC